MDLLLGVLVTVFVIFVAIMSMRQHKQNRGKTYEQRREEVYEQYEQRMEVFRNTEMKNDTPSEDK